MLLNKPQNVTALVYCHHSNRKIMKMPIVLTKDINNKPLPLINGCDFLSDCNDCRNCLTGLINYFESNIHFNLEEPIDPFLLI